MANTKILKIGVGYMPDRKITDPKSGAQKVVPTATFRFIIGDKKLAESIKYNSLPFLNVVGSDLVAYVPASQAETFINGNNRFPKIISELEKVGYLFDISTKGKLLDDLKIAQDEHDNAASQSAVNDITDQYIEDLISGIEKDYNDPRFRQLLDSISVVNTVSNADGNDVIKKTRLSVKNVIQILAQWHKSGRSGIPTYLATQKDWLEIFERRVVQGAVRLVAMRPDDVTGDTTNRTLSKHGLTAQQYYDSPKLQKAVRSLSRDRDYGLMINHAFKPAVYYDVSDTEPIDPNRDLYQGDYKATNFYDNTQDSAATQDDASSATTNDSNSNASNAENKIKESILKYAVKRGDKNLESQANRDLIEAIKSLIITTNDEVLRVRDDEKRNNIIDQVLLVILKKYGIRQDLYASLFKKYAYVMRTKAGKINRQMFIDIMSYANNIINIIDGIVESVNSVNLEFVLGAFGLTMNDYAKMPETEQQADEMMNDVRESFRHTFNNMVNVEKNNRVL